MPEIRAQERDVELSGSGVPFLRQPEPWVAVYATPRHEKHVATVLNALQIEAFLPLYRTKRQWSKRAPVELELPLFPTYVFVRLSRHTRRSVLDVPGVISIVGTGNGPWVIPNQEIQALRMGMNSATLEPHPYLATGDRVRIKTGPMEGVEGILVRSKPSCRLVLSIEMIMQSAAIEVDADAVEPVSRPA